MGGGRVKGGGVPLSSCHCEQRAAILSFSFSFLPFVKGNNSEQATNSMNKRIRTPLEECNNVDDSLSGIRKQKELVSGDKRQRNDIIEVTRQVKPNSEGFVFLSFPTLNRS